MTEQETLDELTSIFRQVFEDDSITARPEMTAADVKRWDSLSHTDMIVMVEQKFGVRIPLREVTRMRNVGDLVRILASMRK
jgi:acyl carrier protein